MSYGVSKRGAAPSSLPGTAASPLPCRDSPGDDRCWSCVRLSVPVPVLPPAPPAPCSSSSSISQHKEPARPGPGSCHFVHGVPGGPFRAELAQCGAGGHRGHPSRVPGTNLEGTGDTPKSRPPPTTAVPVTPRCRAVLTREERGLGSVPAEGAAGGPAASPRFRGCPPPSPPPHRGRRSL